jgi:hypothetical protein
MHAQILPRIFLVLGNRRERKNAGHEWHLMRSAANVCQQLRRLDRNKALGQMPEALKTFPLEHDLADSCGKLFYHEWQQVESADSWRVTSAKWRRNREEI